MGLSQVKRRSLFLTMIYLTSNQIQEDGESWDTGNVGREKLSFLAIGLEVIR